MSSDPGPSVGVAWMEDDGMVCVKLRFDSGSGLLGDANYVFTRKSRNYERVVEYLGGLKPGDARRLTEWDFTLKEG